MTRRIWEDRKIPAADSPLWELFHENSKLHPHQEFPNNDAVTDVMQAMYGSLAAPNLALVPLPKPDMQLKMDLGRAIEMRSTARPLKPGPVSMQDLSTLLYAAYGVNRRNEDNAFPRPFRTVPSGGALYPLELFVHTTRLEDGPAGLLHFDPDAHALRVVDGDRSAEISAAVIEPDCAERASAVIFFTGLFERSVFKYRDRGYRFVLLEAGHVCQNMNLVATALGRRMLNMGGFMDRRIDDILGINGVGHSIVYMAALGGVEK